jgi:hypothetical protein
MKMKRSKSIAHKKTGDVKKTGELTRFGLQVAAAFSFCALLSVPLDALAGELFRTPRRYNTGGSSQRARTVQPSTKSIKILESRRVRSSDTTSLSQSSPYDYRIIQNEKDQAKYELKLAKWQYNVEKQEQKARSKEIKNKEREEQKLEKQRTRERDRAARKQEKIEKEKARVANSGKGFFGSSNQNTNTSTTAKRHGDMFNKSPTSASSKEAPKRLTLWQRMKRWMFGTES